MVWWQWLVSLVFGLIGTAIGGYISYKTMLAQLKNQHDIEQEQHIRQKREELYIKVCHVLMEHEKWCRYHTKEQYCKDIFNELQAQMLIYASKEIYHKYYELDSEIWGAYAEIHTRNKIKSISDKIADKIEAFAADMRQELGIKEA